MFKNLIFNSHGAEICAAPKLSILTIFCIEKLYMLKMQLHRLSLQRTQISNIWIMNVKLENKQILSKNSMKKAIPWNLTKIFFFFSFYFWLGGTTAPLCHPTRRHCYVVSITESTLQSWHNFKNSHEFQEVFFQFSI